MPLDHGQRLFVTYQGSNSWMMLSKRITANNLELNPPIHANANTKNTIRLFHPPGFDKTLRISPLEPASAMLAVVSFFPVCARHVLAINLSAFSKLGQEKYLVESESGKIGHIMIGIILLPKLNIQYTWPL